MEYAFDVELKAAIRVKTLSIRDAKQIILRLDAMAPNELPCYGARLIELSVYHCETLPFETNDIHS